MYHMSKSDCFSGAYLVRSMAMMINGRHCMGVTKEFGLKIVPQLYSLDAWVTPISKLIIRDIFSLWGINCTIEIHSMLLSSSLVLLKVYRVVLYHRYHSCINEAIIQGVQGLGLGLFQGLKFAIFATNPPPKMYMCV